MSFLQKWGLILLVFLLVILGTAGTTWFAADAYYGKQLAAQKADFTRASKDQAAEDAATLARYAQASLEINNELKAELASYSVDITDLGVRLGSASSALRICTNDPVRAVVPVADGSGTAASPPAVAGSTGSTGSTEPSIAVPAGQLRDDLEIGIKGIDSELAYRKLLRAGNQAPQ